MFSNIELRDYFAGMAMQQLLSIHSSSPLWKNDDLAELAYSMADAMLQERVKRDYTVK